MAVEGNSSLGEFLRKEREKRGLTLEQVASATKIGIKFLHALESDQFSELPAKPFVRGFVTSYTRFIGLDHKEVLTLFGDFIEGKAQERPARDAGHSGYAFERRDGDQSRMVLGAVLGAFILVGGVTFLIVKPTLKHHRGSHVEKLRSAHASPIPSVSPLPFAMSSPQVLAPAAPGPSPSVVAALSVLPSPSPTVSPSPSPSPIPIPSPIPSPSHSPSHSPSPVAAVADPLNSGVGLKGAEIKHKAIFKALESVWIRYQVDNRPMMQFVLKKDKILVLRAQEKIVFQARHPEDVQYSYNGSGRNGLKGDRNIAERQGTPTVVFPAKLAEGTSEPFPGEKPLSSLPNLPRSAASPSPTPTE